MFGEMSFIPSRRPSYLKPSLWRWVACYDGRFAGNLEAAVVEIISERVAHV
jgi:hypothetical protein